MKIETYEEVETTNEAETMAHDHESLELIEKLGLAGQKALANPETKTRCPYRQMKTDEHFVFSVLCPKKCAPKKYSASSIPLRVLQIIAWANDNPIFKRIEIWHSDGASIKDPVLVGYMTNQECTWQDDIFIIARWADELLPVEVLFPDAYKVWWSQKKSALLRKRAETENELNVHLSLKDIEHIPENL